MDVEAQAEFWKSGAEEDMAAARCLLKGGHWRQALFLAHLSLEKMLKAHVTRRTHDVPPRTHNLILLAELGGVALDQDRDVFPRAFNAYAFAARYPGSEELPLNEQTARDRFAKAEAVPAWLRKQS
jgi:HEPN domain-containing protein